MIHTFRLTRVLAHVVVCIVLFFSSVPVMAQSLPATPPDLLALNFVEGNSYYFDPESPVTELYTVRGGEIDPSITMSESTRQVFLDSGMIDQFLRYGSLMPDFANSLLGTADVSLQVRIITFPSDQQAAAYVNNAYGNKVAELRDSQSTETATDLTEVPWNDEAVSGYTMPTLATDITTGLNVDYLLVNYAGQQGSVVIMSRVNAPPELAEPIAREMFYAQMACVQADAPCGSFMVPNSEFPQTVAVESQHGGGSLSTSTGEAGIAAPPTTSGEDRSDAGSVTSAYLSTSDHQLESSGNWVVLSHMAVLNNVTEAIPLQGTNDNLFIANVANLEGGDRVAAVLSYYAPAIGTPTLVEDGGTYMLHVVESDGITYGVFSVLEVSSSALDSYVLIYIAPLSTFGTGMADVQASVTVNGMGVLPNVDGAALVPAFGGTVGDPSADALLPPLVGE